MIRRRDFKRSVYHGHDYGELYDLKNDPDVLDSLWDNPSYATIKTDLLKHSFDELAFAVDLGLRQTVRW